METPPDSRRTGEIASIPTAIPRAGAKLVLVGDHRQLGALDAGGLFRLLVADGRAAQLCEVRRFSNPWEAQASLRLRAGDTSVLEEYDARGRITGGDRDEMVEEAFSAWLAARRAGESVIVMAADHAVVDALALRARAVRVQAGEVELCGLAAGTQVVGRGDEIVTTHNDRRLITTAGLWVRNGDRWRVDVRHPDGSLAVSHLGYRGRVVLPGDYVADHVALAYAVTVHKAEGVTVDRAVLLADSATMADHLYVGMTRGRHDTAPVWSRRRPPPATDSVPPDPTSALERPGRRAQFPATRLRVVRLVTTFSTYIKGGGHRFLACMSGDRRDNRYSPPKPVWALGVWRMAYGVWPSGRLESWPMGVGGWPVRSDERDQISARRVGRVHATVSCGRRLTGGSGCAEACCDPTPSGIGKLCAYQRAWTVVP